MLHDTQKLIDFNELYTAYVKKYFIFTATISYKYVENYYKSIKKSKNKILLPTKFSLKARTKNFQEDKEK